MECEKQIEQIGKFNFLKIEQSLKLLQEDHVRLQWSAAGGFFGYSDPILALKTNT